jgi:hypothetical protein
MTTLSERLAAATELTPELREECARMLGWQRVMPPRDIVPMWCMNGKCQLQLPELHLGEIVAEIDRRGLGYRQSAPSCNLPYCEAEVWAHTEVGALPRYSVTRPDRNIQLCAMTALAMAIEGEN